MTTPQLIEGTIAEELAKHNMDAKFSYRQAFRAGYNYRALLAQPTAPGSEIAHLCALKDPGAIAANLMRHSTMSKDRALAVAAAMLGVAPPAPGGDVQMALARMDALLDPERNLLSVSPDSATAQGCRNDMLTIRRALAALQSTAAQGQDAAPAEQPQAVELLDERGEIRRDLKGSAYCVGNEYKPFHPSASHVRPEWRDGWNACFVAAIRAARAKE